MKSFYTLLILLIPFIGFGQNTLLIPSQYTSIQSAIDASSNGDTLKVSSGIYYENLDFNEKSISLVSDYIIDNDTSFINTTIIDGANSGRVLNINYNTVTVIGFTIRNGNHPGGGGIYTTEANITLSNLNIINNNASDDGGGIHCHASDMVLQNSKILLNNAQVFGGGVFIENCTTQNVHIINSEISNNQSSNDGGGIYIVNSIVNIDSSIITENNSSLTGHGGGISIWNNSDVQIEYTLINRNSSNTGGGIYVGNSDVFLLYNDISLNNGYNDGGGLTLSAWSSSINNSSIINCTFYDNQSNQNTSANEIKIFQNGAVFNCSILNSIIWGNINGNINSIEYSNTQQVFSGEGNISVNPNFVDINPLSPNYNLNLGSPCINSGSPLIEFNDPDGTRNDMGAYPLNYDCDLANTSLLDTIVCQSYEWNGVTYTQSGTYEYSEQNDNEYSMSFDGDDDYINYGDILNSIDVPITFIFDVQFDFFGTSIFCTDSDLNLLNDNYFGFWLTADSTSISCSWGDGGFAGGHRRTGNSFVDLSLDNWYNLAVSINGPEDFQFYLDGNALTMDYTDSGNGGSIEHNSFPFTLGVAGVGNNPADFFKGNLDNLQIWDIVLSEQDIQTFMSCPPTGNEEGLIGYWNFEEGEGNVAYDLTGNGNDGAVIGAIYSAEVPENSCQLTTLNGCDSVAVLNLTINQLDTSITDVTVCGSYTWNDSTYIQSGTYDYSVTNYNNNFSLDFNNQNDWISIPPINTGNNYTLQIWAEFPLPITLDGHNTFFSDWNLGGEADITHLFFHNICGLGIGDQFASGNCNVSGVYGTGFMPSSVSNGWHLITAVSEPNQTTFYIDNQNVGSVNHSVSSHIVAIGNNGGGNGVAPQNTGNIDMPTIWDYSLSNEEIEQHLNCPPTGGEAGLISFWDFEEVNGNIALDQTGNENHGTINGATYSTDVPEQSCQLTTVNGCDSVAVLNLTITGPDTSFTEVTACESYEWNGYTYDESGTYYNNINSTNTSLSFNGVSDKLVVNQAINLDSYTFSSWIYLNNTELDYKPIFWIGDNSSSSIEIYGQFDGNNSTTSNHALTVSHNRYNNQPHAFKYYSTLDTYFNQWLFLTVTYESGNVLVYFNGIEQLATDSSGIFSDPEITLNTLSNFGYLNWSGSEHFLDGNLDNVSIWNTALSEQEIQNHMNCPPIGSESGLFGYWNFEEGEGNIVYDLSGNENHGTINGATYNTNVPSQSCALTNANGCDSIAVLNLTINLGDTSYTNITSS